MKTRPSPRATSAATRNGAPAELREIAAVQEHLLIMSELYRRAESELRNHRKHQKSPAKLPKPETDPQRLLHELQVHQIELELQNEELRKTRDAMEAGRDKYTDLYDFAPVGYFTLADSSAIRQVNLNGASLVGIDRSRLVGQSFRLLVAAELRPAFQAFLKQAFADPAKQSADFDLLLPGRPARAVNVVAQRSADGKECRVAVMDITVRKRAEEALQDREARLRAFLKNSAIIGWLKDEDGRHVFLSENYERRFGVRLADWQGKTDFEVWPKKIAEEFRRNDQTVLASGNPIEVIESTTDKEGRKTLWLNNKFTFCDTAGRRYVGGLGVDITARKLAEDKVRVSEIRYRRLFEAAHDGVLLLDPATRKITDANPFMTKLLGYTHDQFVGKELFEIGLLKDASASQEMFQKLKRNHEVRYEDLPLKSKAGRHQEVEVVANLYQENGHTVIQCNIRDITARKLAEQELSEKARLLDLSHDAIIVRDMEGRIRYWNHGAEELYGWSRKEALGKVSHHLLHTEYPTPLKQLTGELHRNDRWVGELVHQTRAGRRITVLVRKTLARDPQGHPASVLQTITDITERKQAEDTRRRMEVLAASNRKLHEEIMRRQAVEESLRKSEHHQAQLLAQSNRQQELMRELSRQILTVQEEERREISRELHDVIAQTLTGINIRLAALKQEATRSTKGLDQKIASTQRLVEKSVEIVHQFARELRPTVLDDLGLIPALHSFLKSFTTRTGVRTSLKAASQVEQLDPARRTVLFRVAQEALTNVARHARASHVEVSLQKSPESICMRITDDGKSFDVARTLNDKGRKRLGLLGMRERLEMVGGSFTIESTPGEGTTVTALIRFRSGGVRGRGGGGKSADGVH